MTRWRTCNNRRRRPSYSSWLFDRIAEVFSSTLWPDEKANWPVFADRLFPSKAEMKEAIDELTVDLRADLRNYGIAITKDGKRVDPNDFYLEPKAVDS